MDYRQFSRVQIERRLRFALGGARGRSIFLQFQRILGHSSNWDFAWDNRSDRRLGGCCCWCCCCGFELFLERDRERQTHTPVHTPCVCVIKGLLGVFQQCDLEGPEIWKNAIIIMVVPPRKRKQVQTMNTTSCAIGQLWIHSLLRVYTGKICRKLSQLGFWGV